MAKFEGLHGDIADEIDALLDQAFRDELQNTAFPTNRKINSMTHGKKITLHLVEAIPTGVIKGHIGNWVGRITYAPRTKMDYLAADPDVQGPGVYVLAGPHPENYEVTIVYVGQSDTVFKRLKQHEQDPEKDYFDSVAVITSSDDTLTKGTIIYLESRLIKIARETQRARLDLDNDVAPSSISISQPDKGVMEEFLKEVRILLPLMSRRLDFVLDTDIPKPAKLGQSRTESTEADSPLFILNTKEQGSRLSVLAKARLINGEFIVLEGSTAFQRNDSQSYGAAKQTLLADGSLVPDADVLRFTRNVPFKSPSAAAAVVRGQNTNGREFWKLETGDTYGVWFDRRIEVQEKQSKRTTG